MARRRPAPYAELNPDLMVVEYLGGPLTREGSDEIAAWANRLHQTEGIGLLAVERREDGAFLGMCGLHHLSSFPDDVEVAWRLAREHWGQGYPTEAATAWLDHGFEVLGPPRVISISDPPNERSIAVMRRLWMTFEQETALEEGGEHTRAVVYAIGAETWKARRAASR